MLNRYTTYVRSHFRGLFKEGQWKKYAAFGLGVMVLDEMVGNHDLYNIDPFMSLFLGTKNIVGKERKDWKDNVAMGVGRWTAKTVMFALYLMYPITVPVILGYGALISAWRQAYQHGLVKQEPYRCPILKKSGDRVIRHQQQQLQLLQQLKPQREAVENQVKEE